MRSCYWQSHVLCIRVIERGQSESSLHVIHLVRKCTFKDFFDSVFPPGAAGIEPNIVFFDHACGLRAYILNRDLDNILQRVAFVVDAWHFPTHSLNDLHCQTFCNPHKFPVLKRVDGSWVFNSSAAEQINSWFGKFQPKVKEMNVTK